MLHAKDLWLLLPLGDEAPQAARMFCELLSLGYSLAVIWRCEPLADGDATVYGALVGAASDDDETKLSDDEVTELQRWRRGCNVMWVGELLRADGRTLRTRFAAELRQHIWNCEADAQRICNVTFGRGRIIAPAPRGRVGLPRAAAWDVIEVGEFVWRDNCVCEVTERRAGGALVRVKEMMVEDMTAPVSVHAFGGTDMQLVYSTLHRGSP